MASQYHRLSPLSSRPSSPADEEEGGALLEASTRPDAYRPRRTAARRCSTVSLVTLGALLAIPFLLYSGSVVGERRAANSASATALAAAAAATDGLVPAAAPEEGQSPSLEELREMVEGSRGYYARDWPLHLGVNNIRYIIEASLHHAELLNRTLIVPTYLWARSCESDRSACDAFSFSTRNKNELFNSQQWAKLPPEQQLTWRIPLGWFYDIPRIRSSHRVVTIEEYLLLNDLPPTAETGSGKFDHATYVPSPALDASPSSPPFLHTIPYSSYDSEISRVDVLPPNFISPSSTVRNSSLGVRLRKDFDEDHTRDWSDAVSSLGADADGLSDEEIEIKLRQEAGAYTLYTWKGPANIDHAQSIGEERRQVALGEVIRGFSDDFANSTAKVVLLQGETHSGRKPGALRFTSLAAQRSYGHLVISQMVPPPSIFAIATRVVDRMSSLVGGRSWVAAHYRRTDMVTAGFSMNSDPYAHLERVLGHANTQREMISSIKATGSQSSSWADDVPLSPYADLSLRPASLKSDPMYIATDSRNATVLAYIRERGGVLISELLTPQDRIDLKAFPLLFTDVLGVLEQQVLARAAGFYGHAMSSVAGGVINLRLGLGHDPRLSLLD